MPITTSDIQLIKDNLVPAIKESILPEIRSEINEIKVEFKIINTRIDNLEKTMNKKFMEQNHFIERVIQDALGLVNQSYATKEELEDINIRLDEVEVYVNKLKKAKMPTS